MTSKHIQYFSLHADPQLVLTFTLLAVFNHTKDEENNERKTFVNLVETAPRLSSHRRSSDRRCPDLGVIPTIA